VELHLKILEKSESHLKILENFGITLENLELHLKIWNYT